MYFYIMPNGDGRQYVASEMPPSGKYKLLTQEEYEKALEELAEETIEQSIELIE